MKKRRRRHKLGAQLLLLGSVTLILAVASLLSRRIFEDRRPEMPVGLTPVAPIGLNRESPLFRVTQLQGEAETFQNGQWYVVRAGHLLSTMDVLRTKSGARATLRRGSVEIELHDNMDIRLDDLEKETASFGLLRGGRVSASVGDARDQLAITARHTRAENVGAARFVVSMSATGKVSVATSEGAARFSGAGKEVAVPAGSSSTALPDQAPGDPEPIPAELLLSVIWPEDDRVEHQAKVRGKAQPSSRVNVNGAETEVGPDGTFTATVPMKLGKNHIQVEAEDIVGRTKTVDKTVTRAAPAPILEPSGDELWNP
jgi:hypothetical protein